MLEVFSSLKKSILALLDLILSIILFDCSLHNNAALPVIICANFSVEMTAARKNVFQDIDVLPYEKLSQKYYPKPKFKERVKISIKTNTFIKKWVIPLYKKLFRK